MRFINKKMMLSSMRKSQKVVFHASFLAITFWGGELQCHTIASAPREEVQETQNVKIIVNIFGDVF